MRARLALLAGVAAVGGLLPAASAAAQSVSAPESGAAPITSPASPTEPTSPSATTTSASPTAASPTAGTAATDPPNGGAPVGEPPPGRPRRRPRHRPSGPLLRELSASRSVVTGGRPGLIRFLIRGRGPTVHVWLDLHPSGAGLPTTRLDLGQRPTGREVVVRWRPSTRLRGGTYVLGLRGRDAAGRRMRRRLASTAPVSLRLHVARFPVAGRYSYGGSDARFGAPRRGHTHQGQDVFAAEGTPLVAPRAGRVTWRAYQAGGAGYYLVIRGDADHRDYVFMHLERGSTVVRQGQHVRTGQRIGRVGATGDAFGPHLHFEIWVGGWYSGGHPIDPLPTLRRWARA